MDTGPWTIWIHVQSAMKTKLGLFFLSYSTLSLVFLKYHMYACQNKLYLGVIEDRQDCNDMFV